MSEIASDRKVPRYEVRTAGQIFSMLQFKARRFDPSVSFFDLHHIRDPISLFDPKSDLAMMWIGRIVFFGHEPFVDSKYAPGFQDSEYFGVDSLETGGVDGCFDGIDGVEAVVWER